MGSAEVELMNTVRDQALQECVDLSLELIASQLDRGNAFGDRPISRADRIARFVDFADRGILDILEGMGAPVYEVLIAEYIVDMEASPLMQPTPSTARYLGGA
jgi:hypothetical protein